MGRQPRVSRQCPLSSPTPHERARESLCATPYPRYHMFMRPKLRGLISCSTQVGSILTSAISPSNTTPRPWRHFDLEPIDFTACLVNGMGINQYFIITCITRRLRAVYTDVEYLSCRLMPPAGSEYTRSCGTFQYSKSRNSPKFGNAPGSRSNISTCPHGSSVEFHPSLKAPIECHRR